MLNSSATKKKALSNSCDHLIRATERTVYFVSLKSVDSFVIRQGQKKHFLSVLQILN